MPFDNADRRRPGRGTGERAINLPPAVMWLIGINVAVHLLRGLLGDEADNALILQFGLVPAAYTGGSHDLLSQVLAPITYQFLHGGWMHLGVNMVTLAAFGAPVERLLGVRRFLLFYLSAGVVAAFVHGPSTLAVAVMAPRSGRIFACANASHGPGGVANPSALGAPSIRPVSS